MNPRKLASLFQFSIRGLFIGVTILSVGIAALLNANGWSEADLWGGTIFLLATGVLLAIYRQAGRRAFWLGFSVFGWLYLAVVIYSWTPSANPQVARTDPLVESSLITTRLSHVAYNSLLPETKKQPSVPMKNGDGSAVMTVYYTNSNGQQLPMGEWPVSAASSTAANTPSLAFTPSGTLMGANPNYVPIENFTHITHALWLLLIAAVGGKTCQLIYGTRPNTEE
jgi:hypothetical protein